MLLCLSNTAHATGPRVSAALFTSPVNEIFALDFPAVLNSNLDDGGIAAAIITAAFKAENVESTVTPLPLQTMLSYYLNEENALGIVGHNLNLSAAESKNVILVPVLRLKESYFYFRPKHETLTWTGKLAELKSLKIGLNKGDNLTAYQKAGVHVEQDRLEPHLKSLMDGKIDVLREANWSLTFVLTKNFADKKASVVQLEPSAGEAVISVAFNKKNPKGTALAKQFQQGLAKLVASNHYTEILKKYAGDTAMEQYFNPLSH